MKLGNMVALQQTDLIDKAAGEAFSELARTADRFERYEHPHAQRIAAIADELALMFHLGRHDRGSLNAAALLHDLGATHDLANPLYNFGHACLHLGDVERAQALFTESLALHQSQQNTTGMAECFVNSRP